jgi:hypothetical protein
MERWGWVLSTKEVADFENIAVSQAYALPVIQYLNTLAYLKDLNKAKEAQYKKWELQQRRR